MGASVTDTLGPYELRGELGRGAMAIVWRAFDPKLEREIAIKEPTIGAGVDSAMAEELAARFVREGRAAAQLNHPGIVTIYAADVYDGRPAIVMELIEGTTLSEVICAGRLAPHAALGIIDQLLDAVGYAHARGVVHRDIKPDNVFVTNDGRVKLADFGIAHVGTTATLTQAGSVMGTPGYMAPEQVIGDRVDARTDIFAVGAIAYELLSGRNPFGIGDGAHPTAVMYRIVHEHPERIADLSVATLPLDVRPAIEAAMAKEPDDRFPDAEAFRSALRGGPLPAGGVVSSHGPARRKLTSGGVALAGVAGIAVLAVVLMFASAMRSGAEGSQAEAQKPTAPASTAASATPSAEPVAQPPSGARSVKVTAYGASVEIPDDWIAAGVTTKSGLRTYKAESPSGATIRVDQNTALASSMDDAWKSATGVESGLTSRPSYQRISMEAMRVSGRDAVRWEFILEDKKTGVTMHKVDVFFQDEVPGYPTAVVVGWPEGDDDARDEALAVLESLEIP